MPRPKLNTLDQPPYPTPSTSPTSPLSTPSSLKGLNAPPSPTTKPRIGQSILGQLLAPHKGRNHYTLANDAALSLETIRPKEQRRSGLPASWAFGFSRTTTAVPSPSTLNVTPLAVSMANRKGRAVDPDQHYQTVLPSAWLEKILAGLSKSRTEVPPHYATLPKDGYPGSSTTSAPRSVMSLFDSKGKSPRLSKDSKPPSSKLKRFSELPIPSSPLTKPGTLSPTPMGALLHTERPEAPHKMVRRSSACELALGEEARELFQQNRPKTLSSAVISSTIVKHQKGSVQETKGMTSDSTTSTSSSSSTSSTSSSSSSTSLDNSEAPTMTESVSGTPPTTTVTRGRFTIESSSSTPMASPMARTRTLSTASTSALPMAPVTSFSSSYLAPPTLTPGGTRPNLDQPTISLSPASPLSFSLPSSSMTSARPSSSSRSFSVPSGSTPPSNGSTSSSSSSCSNPISIPRATRSNHQRTHSNSSVQSSGSTSSSSRRSQVIIPPANTASLQFASFSSMASSSSGTGNGNVPSSARPPAVKRANSSNNNNFRNLSIHVLGKDTDDEEDSEAPPRPESDGSQVFHLESSVHPLDHPMMLSSRVHTSPNLMHHQTMHRVNPHSHVHVDSPSDSTGSSASMTRCGSFCCSSGRSSLNSLSSFGANEMPTSVEYGPACHAGYFRQRSLSTTHLDSSLYNNSKSGSSPVPVPIPSASSYHHPQHLQPQRHSSSWSDRPGRRTHGSLSHEPSHLPHHLHQLHNRNSTPSLLSHGHGQLLDSSGSTSKSSFGETSDVVMVKKSATGRMFTVERTIPASPTRCSRFIVVSAEEEAAQAAAAEGGGSRSHTPLSSTPTH
ncbi:hypothetical protein BGZ93_008181 [Podila epicladia]|nr:hypothetical protein BGZ92_008278 [Podila epicladia]KAG0092759.1 hypothetical protein BGZ93_008181 [Podila epicladia]